MAPTPPVHSRSNNTLISAHTEGIESRDQEEASMGAPSKDSSNCESDANAVKAASTTHAENTSTSMAKNCALEDVARQKHDALAEINAEGINQAAMDGSTADSTTTDSNQGTEENSLSFVISQLGGHIETVRQPAGQFLDARQQRILENIQHRRKILSWVRGCRLASEKMIESIARGEKENFIRSLIENEPRETKGGVTEELGVSSEVEDFRKLTSLASSSIFLKRLKSGIPFTENSATRELRKGSNIGKRMSAAVSTLNNSGDRVSSDSSASQAIAGGQHDTSVVSSASILTNNTHPHSSKAIVPIPTTNSALSPLPCQVIEKNSISHVQPKVVDEGVLHTNHQKAEKMQKKAKKRSSSINKLNLSGVDVQGNINANAIDHSGPTRIEKFGASKPSTPQHVAPLMTLSLDASKIIDERDSIAMQLKNLLSKRLKESLDIISNDVSEHSKSGGCTLHAKSKVSNHAPNTVGQFVSPSSTQIKPVITYDLPTQKEVCCLPLRRKTHWDFVLEEMRWLATDFIEERKWKLACGRNLSVSLNKRVTETESANKSKTKLATEIKTTTHQNYFSGQLNGSNKLFFERKEAVVDDSGLNNPICLFSEDAEPMFVDPSHDDMNITRDISRFLSISVAEHWGTTLNEDEFPFSDHSTLEDRRLQILYDHISSIDNYGSCGFCTNSSSAMNIDTLSPGEASVSDNESLSALVEHPTTTVKIPELDHTKILQEIQSSVDLVDSLKTKTLKSLEKEHALQNYRATFECGIKLSRIQLNMIHLIENIWKVCANVNSFNADSATSNRNRKTSIAAILGGAFSMGKTVAICSLVWKNRNIGPQVILCSPCMMLRWKHELSRYNGLSVLTAPIDFRSYHTCDVLLCDYASFVILARLHKNLNKCDEDGINDDKKNTRTEFCSLVLDLRHNGSADNFGPQHISQHNTPSNEVENPKWWSVLNKFILRCNDLKRLVIEQYNLAHDHFALQRPCVADEINHFDGVLAMKVAFIFHPSLFLSDQTSLGKRVISWAKQQWVQGGSMGNIKGSFFLKNKIHHRDEMLPSLAHRLVLLESLRAIREPIVELLTREKSSGVVSKHSHLLDDVRKHSWDLRFCVFSNLQQKAYDRCCYLSRGSLSQSYKSVLKLNGRGALGTMTKTQIANICEDAHHGVAKTLLQLRRVCLHSDVDGFVSKLPSSLRKTLKAVATRGSNGRHLINSNATGCSEPDIDTAKDVASKSSKMRELLLVLASECGFTVPLESEFKQVPESKREHEVRVCHGRTNLKRRVLILATLIEAQLLTSFFLNALGLRHEILISGFRTVEAHSNNDLASSICDGNHYDHRCERKTNSFSDAPKSALAWEIDQPAFPSSNVTNSVEPNRCFQSCAIIVASPTSISVENGGICGSSPDIVISVDEDWSGREAFHISKILTRIRFHEQSRPVAAATPSCKFIKLICANTCEDTFLCREDTHELVDVEIGTKIAKNELRKRSTRIGSRKSPPSDRPIDKFARSGIGKSMLGSNNVTSSSTKSKLYFPNMTQFNDAAIRTDGYLSPLSGHYIDHTTSQKIQWLSVGSNILRHRNEMLSSVLCQSNKSDYHDMFFMPNFGQEEFIAPFFSDSELSNMFSAALSWREGEASNLIASYLISSNDAKTSVNTGCELPPFSFSPSSVAVVGLKRDSGSSSIRYYMKLMGKRFQRTTHELDKKQPPLSLSSGFSITSLALFDEVSKIFSSQNEKTRLHQEEFTARKVTKTKVIDHSKSILVYETPLDRVSFGNDHHLGANQPTLPYTSHNRLSLCFSLCNDPDFSSRLSEGIEPTTYIPSFFPVLLQIIPNAITADSSHGTKRKSYDGISSSFFESKKTKAVDTSNGIPPFLSQNTEDPFELPDLQLSPTGSFDFDPSPIPSVIPTEEAPPDFLLDYFINETVETCNYFSGSNYAIIGNVESFFTKKLLAFDAGGASISHRSLRLGSMILVTQTEKSARNKTSSNHSTPLLYHTSAYPKPIVNSKSNQGSSQTEIKGEKSLRPTNQAYKKSSGKKKIKKHHHNLKIFSHHDRLNRPYFAGEFLRKRMISARGGVKYDYASSRLGLARFRFRLNDMVATSFLALERTQIPCKQGVDRNITHFPSTATTRIHVGQFDHVVTTNDFKSQSRDYYRCGISLPMGVRTPRLAKLFSSSLEETIEPWTDAEDLLLSECASRYNNNWHLVANAVSVANNFSTFKSRRSPKQCQNRWVSLANRDHAVSFGGIMTKSKPFSDGNEKLTSITMDTCFGNTPENDGNESLIFCQSSCLYQSLQRGSSSIKTEAKDSLHMPSRSDSHIKKLNDIANKKRIIPISILGSNSEGTETTVRLVPIHPSHSESVQAARLTLHAASSNRVAPPPEMWPLKLLDYTDKHRAATANPKAIAAEQNLPRGPAVPPRQTQPRQSNTRPPIQQSQQPCPPMQLSQPNSTSYYPYSAPQNTQHNRHK